MPQVTYKQLYDTLRQTGFSIFQATVMLAISAAESGLNTDTVGDNGQSYGLFQIYQPVWGTKYGPACATDVQCSAKAAWEISNHGTDFNPWSVYRFSSYGSQPQPGYPNPFTKYMSQAMAAVGFDPGTTIDLIVAGTGASNTPNSGDTTDPYTIVDNLTDAEIKQFVSGLSDDVATQLLGFLPSVLQTAVKDTGNALGAALAAVVPTSLLRSILKQLPEPVLRGALATAGLIGSAIGAVTDPIGSIMGLFPSLSEVEAGIVAVTLLFVGLAFVGIGAWGLVQKSDTTKTVINTATKAAATAALA